MKKLIVEPYINPITSITIMLSTVATVFFTGAILAVFATSYESSCVSEVPGKPVCTQNFKFLGWGGVPLNGIAGGIGTGIGIYAAVKSGKLPGMNAPLTEEESTDVPS